MDWSKLAKLNEAELDRRFDLWVATMPGKDSAPELISFMRLAYKKGALEVMNRLV